MRSRLLRASPLLVGLAIGVASCGVARPTSFPDQPGIATAQAGWCDMLARVTGGGEGWDRLADCKAATPGASAEYIKLLTTCFEERKESLGDNAPDMRRIAANCNDEVLFHLPVEGAAHRGVLTARCDRMARCEKIAVDECMAALDRLEASQRAIFTTSFNQAALSEVSACLAETSCTEDEETTRNDCYLPVNERLLWFPL